MAETIILKNDLFEAYWSYNYGKFYYSYNVISYISNASRNGTLNNKDKENNSKWQHQIIR